MFFSKKISKLVLEEQVNTIKDDDRPWSAMSRPVLFVASNSKCSLCRWRNSNSRLHNNSRGIRFLAIARREHGVSGIGRFSASLLYGISPSFSLWHNNGRMSGGIGDNFSDMVNCYSESLVRQADVPCTLVVDMMIHQTTNKST